MPNLKKRRRKSLSSLMLIILAVNMIPLLLMGFGIFYLDQYKQNLITPAYSYMESQLRLINQLYEIRPEALETPIEKIDNTIFMVNEAGDITEIYNGRMPKDRQATRAYQSPSGLIETLASILVHLNPLQTNLPDLPDLEGRNIYEQLPEAALARNSNDIAVAAWEKDESFVLTAVLPRADGGASVMVYNGELISAAINDVRMDIMKAFVFVLIVTFLLSIYLSSFIAIPLKRLARAAEAIRKGRAGNDELPDLSERHDEIGELSIALREMTEALHRRIDLNERFAADVTHEIKNPLTSLRSAIETARNVKKNEDRDRLMNIIDQDVARLDKMISSIAHITRLDVELARNTFSTVDLKKLLTELVELWQPPLSRLAAQEEPDPALQLIVLHMPDQDIEIYGRGDSLAQVFQNLISNAISFNSTKQPVDITVNTNGEEVTVIVQDYGPGIPDNLQQKIFERFYTDRTEEYKSDNNSGLGLSIVKQIVEAHHGDIYVENHKNEQGNLTGARFIVTLPLNV